MNNWQKSDGSIPLILQVQHNYVPVSGIIPTVEIRRYSDDFYANFGTLTFVNTGGTRHTPMPEESGRPGVYRKDFYPNDFGEVSLRQLYIMNYRATIPSGYTEDVLSDINISEYEVNFFEPPASGISTQCGLTADFIS